VWLPSWLLAWLLAGLPFLGPALQAGAPGSRKKVSIAMVLWRGETESEEAFRESLAASPDFDPQFTVFDAQVDKDRLAAKLAEVKKGRFDLIYAFGTLVAQSLAAIVRDTPVVFNIVARPLESGLIRSWEDSGSNLTGVSNAVPMASAFRSLRLLMHIRKLGFIYNPAEPNATIQLKEVEDQQAAFGFRVVPLPLPRAEEVQATLSKVVGSGLDAVMLPSDSLVQTHAEALLAFLNRYGMPTIATIPDMARTKGALLALGPDYRALGALAAASALEVLRGKAPSRVPSRTGQRLVFVINKKTAKRLGITLPIPLVKMSTLVG
jgi:putative ABC transport system substrate-binding protein